MEYTPIPIDTSKVVLESDLLSLTEKLAKNAHEIWAKQRFSEGWTYGKERNDKKKHHPDLLPYQQLTDNEQEYDRLTAKSTLKLLISLGYSVIKKDIDMQKEEFHNDRASNFVSKSPEDKKEEVLITQYIVDTQGDQVSIPDNLKEFIREYKALCDKYEYFIYPRKNGSNIHLEIDEQYEDTYTEDMYCNVETKTADWWKRKHQVKTTQTKNKKQKFWR